MSRTDAAESAATVTATNVGGIDETSVEVPPGVTILTGRNATNRTSFLQAVMAAVGSENASLKGDADEGRVELTLDGETYRRTLRREGRTVVYDGDPYLDDPTVADLFAFLLESNEARRAVVRGDNLRELIMRPVDTDEITAEIDRLERRQDEIDDQLADLDALKEELPGLEERKQQLSDEIEEQRETLEAVETEIEEMDADVDERREEQRELDERLDELRRLRADLDEVRSDIEVEEESLASLRSERADLEDEQSELPDAPRDDTADLDDDLARLREEKSRLETTVRNLQDVIQFNEDLLDGEQSAVGDALDAESADGAVTDRLLDEDDETVCWTCGSTVPRARIEETLSELRSVRQERTTAIREIEADIEDLRTERQQRERRRRRRAELQQELADVETEIERREDRLERLRERRERLGEEIEEVEAAVDDLDSATATDVLDKHKEANRIEFELGRLASDLDDVTDRIATIEERLGEESTLVDRREEIQDELEAQRTRIDRIEREAVEAFNQHMDDILDTLAYENLARIWIERVTETVREGRQHVEQTRFVLHVVRTTDAGTTYEDTVDHLSESEREVTGLTFALAGYLVHDVHETVPFVLLDSLEAIDAERIAALVSHFAPYATYLVVALLPEDAQALPDEYARITEI